MHRFVLRTTLLAAIALAFAHQATLQAQSKQPPEKKEQKATPPAMDHSKMDHSQMAGGKAEAWKELDAFHMQMMATWHPAKGQNDMAPLKAKVGDMVAAAKVLAASKAPAGCQKPEMLKVQAELPVESQKLADMVKNKASDADLKTALSALHDKFEVLGDGCNTGMMH